jgi:hypothetical protein
MNPRNLTLTAALALLPALAGPAAALTYTLSGDNVSVWSPAGAVRVVAATGNQVEVEVTLGGPDASELQVSTDAIGGHSALRVLYPGNTITYPAMGRGSSSRTSIRSDGTWGGPRNEWSGSRRITVKGSEGGTEAWADLVVKVPKGRKVSVYNIAGKGAIQGVDGKLSFDSGSGSASASNCKGQLSIDVGSGRVTVDQFTGELNVDTGSGSIDVNGIRGPSARLDTGSGRISGSNLVVDDLLVDTGSGSVDLSGLDTKHGRVDTGSGGVEVGLLTSAPDLTIDTGSGSVRISVPQNFSARLHIETGSGGIRSELPVTIDDKEHGLLRGTIGSGSGRLKVDTGSGGVSLLASAATSRSKSQ